MRSSYLILIMLFASTIAMGQKNSDMLTFQIDGNNYIKKNYDKNGVLEDYQIIQIGEITSKGDKNIVPIRSYSYNDKGQILDSSRTSYICDPTDKKLVMNVFPFAYLSANKTVKLKSKTKISLYPKEWKTGDNLPNTLFSVDISGGSLSVFGSTAKIEIYDRKITEYDKSRNAFNISSKLRIGVYAYGIKVKSISYTIEEKVNPEKGIIEQKFKESTGAYFTIKLN